MAGAKPSTPMHPTLVACDALGELTEFWGFRRSTGRIWMWLFLKGSPTGAQEIGEGLEMSAGAVSMALSEMEHWGFIIRRTPRGTRMHAFEAETKIWSMVVRVAALREMHHFGKLVTLLKTVASNFDATDQDKAKRLRRLVELMEWGIQLFSLAFIENQWDRVRLLKLAKLRERFLKATDFENRV